MQLDFWQCLEGALKSKFGEMVDSGACDRETIRQFYFGSRGNRYYGLAFAAARMAGTDTDVAFRIEIENALYYGFLPMRKKERLMPSDDSESHRIALLVKNLDVGSGPFLKSPNWFGYRWTRPVFNFEAFDEDCINLADEQCQKKSMSDLVDEIGRVVSEFQQTYKPGAG